MNGCRLESVPVVAAHARELVAQHGLRCADPPAYRCFIATCNDARRMQIEIATELPVLNAGSQEKGGGLHRARGDNDRGRMYHDRVARARMFVDCRCVYAGGAARVATEAFGTTRCDNGRASLLLRVAKIRHSRRLFGAHAA